MSIKKYSSGSWVTVPYRKYETATDTITSLPKTIIGDGQPISAYTIKGNMQQSGTPTPSNPIYPQECGDLVTSGEHAGEYKIPILSNGVSYPIYLSEPIRKISTYVDDCQSTGITTRKVYKLVITGNEGWTLSQVSGNVDTTRFYLNLSVLGATAACLCNYLTYDGGNADTPHIRIGNTEHNQLLIYVPSSLATTTTELATWLQGLYNNGNPLTVWYPLGTSTTENFTAPSIPTTGTAQTFDVDTTLAPSEVSLTYHGWHEHTDTKYSNP